MRRNGRVLLLMVTIALLGTATFAAAEDPCYEATQGLCYTWWDQCGSQCNYYQIPGCDWFDCYEDEQGSNWCALGGCAEIP